MMLFDPEGLKNKMQWLDKTLHRPELLHRVIGRYLPVGFTISHIPRIMEPGGGSTLYRIESLQGRFLLKVKHMSVWVESRLESEPSFTRRSSLQNEFEMLQSVPTPWVPKVLFFEEEESFHFLAVEWLDNLESALERLTALDLVKSWDQLLTAARYLYENGLVHTDFHEHNICFRGDQVVLVDFEEARRLRQQVPFEESLDFCGVNRYGSTGRFPGEEYTPLGYTCLKRLRRVFVKLVLKKLDQALAGAHFDQRCPFNQDPFQQPDDRVYQPLSSLGILSRGHRSTYDPRMAVFSYLLYRLGRRMGEVRHLDIGSNIGAFCIRAASYPFVSRSRGVEAWQVYTDLSAVLAFVAYAEKVEFFNAVCGDQSLLDLAGDANFVTMFSVYHHIVKRDELLNDLRSMGSPALLGEFATEDRYYNERGTLLRELQYIRDRAGYAHMTQIGISPDYRRPMYFFSPYPLSPIDRTLAAVLARKVGSAIEGLRYLNSRLLLWRRSGAGYRRFSHFAALDR
ncbi:MAG: RIO1 family regulatory kinase/ATPase [Pseudomonadota bacterium]